MSKKKQVFRVSGFTDMVAATDVKEVVSFNEAVLIANGMFQTLFGLDEFNNHDIDVQVVTSILGPENDEALAYRIKCASLYKVEWDDTTPMHTVKEDQDFLTYMTEKTKDCIEIMSVKELAEFLGWGDLETARLNYRYTVLNEPYPDE